MLLVNGGFKFVLESNAHPDFEEDIWFKKLRIRFARKRHVGLGGLGVTYSLLDLRLAGSNSAKVDRFFLGVKIYRTSPPGGTLSCGSRL